MKRLFLILITLSIAFATGAAAADRPDGWGIDKDVAYNWKADVLDKGVKSGTPEWKTAAKMYAEFDQRFSEAKALATEGWWCEAADAVPYSWVEAWYRMNCARDMIGEIRDDGTWEYNNTLFDDPDLMGKFADTLNLAEAAMNRAVKVGLVGVGSNAPEKFEAYLKRYRAEFLKLKE